MACTLLIIINLKVNNFNFNDIINSNEDYHYIIAILIIVFFKVNAVFWQSTMTSKSVINHTKQLIFCLHNTG